MAKSITFILLPDVYSAMNRSIEISPPHGLEEVYAEYRTYFVRIAVSYVRDRMVAEDLVSDTFLKIWESRTETTPRNLPAYLLTALKRKCLDLSLIHI